MAGGGRDEGLSGLRTHTHTHMCPHRDRYMCAGVAQRVAAEQTLA